MRIHLVTPAAVGSRHGNRTTAERWAALLGHLGHRVTVAQQWSGERCELLVALHARRSHASIERFHRELPDAPLLVALTGTDLYADLSTSPEAQRSLEMATRLIGLQPLARDALAPALRSKFRVIFQSAEAPPRPASPDADIFQVIVLAHLREVKDPLRAAYAVRNLPQTSRLRVVHIGGAMSPEWEQAAREEEQVNARYRWLGELPREQALHHLASSRLLVLSSRLEGGANVVSEALAASVPVISSRIPGSIGILGADYPGYFPVGDAEALRALLLRAESDAVFYEKLRDWCACLKPLVHPHRERESWRQLLSELCCTAPPVD